MEKEDFERCLSTMEEISDLIIRLAGNAVVAKKVLADTELERDYNLHTLCVDDREIVEALHDIAIMKTDMENGRDCCRH